MSIDVWTTERMLAAIASVASWHGTPHADFLAMRGKGVDCIHLVTEVLADAGIVERKDYGRYDPSAGTWSVSRKLVFAVESALHVERCMPDPAEFGQLWIFRTGGRSGHIGILIDGDLWHALARRMVTKSDARGWMREVDVAFRLVNTGWKSDPPAVARATA